MANSSPGAAKRRYYARYIANYTKKNNTVIALGILFVAGVVLGSLLLRGAGEETAGLLERMMGGFISRRREAGMYENFISALSSSMGFTAALFVCGFCAIAQPLIVVAPLLRGLGFGFSAASLYARYGASAAGFVGVLLLPGMLLSTVAVLICCKQALRLSGAFFLSMRQGAAKAAEPYSLRAYCLNYTFAAGICAVSAFVEAVLYYVFANSFILG